MTSGVPLSHSRPAVQRLAEIADGPGGQVVLVTGGPAPYYAGLRRGGAATLIEAVLTLLNPDKYAEILLVTGQGEHLPDVPLTETVYCGRQRAIWLFKKVAGNAAQDGAASAATEDDELIEYAQLKPMTNRQGRHYEVEVPSYLSVWPDQMNDLIERIGGRLERGGPHRLIVIDDQFLQPRASHENDSHLDRPAGAKRHGLARNFSALPANCRDSATDIVLLCRSNAHRSALTDRTAAGPIAYEMSRDAGESAYGREEAERNARAFPNLQWPDVEAIDLGNMEPQRWNAGWLPGADPERSFYDILRSMPPVPPPDPLAALDKFIGMEAVRAKLDDLRELLRVREDEIRRGQDSEPIGLHVALYGQPGTGKTEVAKAIAQIYSQLGILTGPFVNCAGRAELVGGYIGQTALKTRKKLDEARGGVLFIDEAYSLARGGENDFGAEAITELLSYMTSYKDQLAVIAAGYPAPMRNFLRANEGLNRRFTHHINMPEYTDDQLVDIVALQARRSGKRVEDAARIVIREKLAAHRRDCAAARLSFGFAGDAVNLLEKARLAQARRFRGNNVAAMSDEQVALLTVDDFRTAMLDLPGQHSTT